MEHVEPAVPLPEGWTQESISCLNWSTRGHELYIASIHGDILITDVQHLQVSNPVVYSIEE